MKFNRRFKFLLFVTLTALYGSGLIKWAMDRWFQVDGGFGMQDSGASIQMLHFHSVVSLWFLVLFGYIFHSHVQRGWRAKMKLKSGLFFIVPLILVILTVPGLFYLTDENVKSTVVQAHVYVGLWLLLPFVIHLLSKSTLNKSAKTRKPLIRAVEMKTAKK